MSLKITEHDFNQLKAAIAEKDTEDRRKQYQEGRFPRADRVADKDRRYRWDLLHASGLKLGDGVGIQGDLNLYAYLDDTHIDSALRAIVPPLQATP